MYLYRHAITLHETHSVITGTEHPMLICIIIIYVLELNLPKSNLPFDALQCDDIHCISHRNDIDQFYYNIINVLISCTKQCIPVLKLHDNNYIAGWNEHVSHYHNVVRTEFKWWVSKNRPRHGPIYHALRSSRARIKYALRQCRYNER